MRPVIVYTASRLGLLAVTAGVLYLIGARGIVLLLLALVISGLVSYVLLARQRDYISEAINKRRERHEP